MLSSDFFQRKGRGAEDESVAKLTWSLGSYITENDPATNLAAVLHKPTQHGGSDPIKWPNILNPEFGQKNYSI